MFVHYNTEGDFLEIRFGKPTESYYEDIGDDIFKRIDEKTKKVRGYAFFNVKKRQEQQPKDIEIPLSELSS